MTVSENLNKSTAEYLRSFLKWEVIAGIYGLVVLGFGLLSKPFDKTLLNEVSKEADMNIWLVLKVSFILLALSVISNLVTFLFSIGTSKCAIENTRGRLLKISDLFFGFRVKPFKFLGLYIWEMILILLWSCLFIVPGIIKGLSYSQAFFLMIENPEYGIRESVNKSKMIMEGHKMKLFVLWLITIIPIMALSMIPYIGVVIAIFLFTPFSNLIYLNFYNDITLYGYDDKNHFEDELF
jgi:uncharacterized membrane protein